jgi:hypothetical protein
MGLLAFQGYHVADANYSDGASGSSLSEFDTRA